MALHAINLCDGYSGFELAWRHLGLDVRTVARVERDSYAAAVLVERMEEARLDCCPIWDDLTTFDGAAWRGRVDLITAGFPCQPFSAAGSRLGLDDDRWLWPSIARLIAAVGPGWVVLENVPGVVGAGLPEVLCDLANLGFDAEWGLLSAADVGAPHQRQRFWLVARSDGDGRLRVRSAERRSGRVATNDVDRCGSQVADSDESGIVAAQQERQRIRDADTFGVRTVGHTGSPRRPKDTRSTPSDERADGWQPHRDHIADRANKDVGDSVRSGRWWSPGTECTDGLASPPGRDDVDGWRRYIAEGGPQPVLRRRTDGPPLGLADALHLGGNGLVPAAAAEAFRQLATRGGWLT